MTQNESYAAGYGEFSSRMDKRLLQVESHEAVLTVQQFGKEIDQGVNYVRENPQAIGAHLTKWTDPQFVAGARAAVEDYHQTKSQQFAPQFNYEQLEQRIQQLTERQPLAYEREGRSGFQRLEKQIVALENEVVSRFPDSRLGQEIRADRTVEQAQNYSVMQSHHAAVIQPVIAQQFTKETHQMEQDFGVSF